MIRFFATFALCTVLLGLSIDLQGQTKGTNNQTPEQADAGRNAPSQQVQPSTTNEIVNAATSQPAAQEKQSYGQTFIDNLLTDPIVWLTVVLGWLAWVQLQVYRAEVKDTKTVERAYVSMSHNRPGLRFGDKPFDLKPGDPRIDVSVNVKVKNNGNTPGIVSFQLVQLIWQKGSLPAVPPYSENNGRVIRASLVKDESW